MESRAITCKECGKTKQIKDIRDLDNHICKKCHTKYGYDIFPYGCGDSDSTMGDLQAEMHRQAYENGELEED